MKNGAHYLHPSTLLVFQKPSCISTILGSCVSVCLYDPVRKTGGMNHYMLPYWNGKGLPSPKFGNIAIKKLIEEMIHQGSNQNDLKAKVFGGANITQQNHSVFYVDKLNIAVANDLLKEYNIPVISSCTGGNRGRKIKFNTETGKVLHKFIINHI